MRGDTFEPGQELGGFRILRLLEEGHNQESTRYQVARVCCGEVLEQTHDQIYRREQSPNRRCRPCRFAGVDLGPAIRAPAGVRIETGPMRGWWPSLTPMGFRGV